MQARHAASEAEQARQVAHHELEDAYENMGAQMVREVASKTNDEAGCGGSAPHFFTEAVCVR